MRVCWNNEFWRKVRSVVEAGLSLQKAAKQFGVSRAHLCQRARVEEWQFPGKGLIGRPRTMDYPDGTRRVEMAKEEANREAREAQLLVEARVALFDTKKAELAAQNILAQHSPKIKVALSELVLQTALDLRSAEVRPKDSALAMVALKTVSNRLYGWDREPDLQSMKLARKGGDELPTAAVNLALIATTPEQLAVMAGGKFDPDIDDYFGDHTGPSATECNGQGVGASVGAPEKPLAATPGQSISEKEPPKPPRSASLPKSHPLVILPPRKSPSSPQTVSNG